MRKWIFQKKDQIILDIFRFPIISKTGTGMNLLEKEIYVK